MEILSVTPAEVAKPDFLLLDVRKAESFELAHIEGAINIPKQENKWPTLRAGVRSSAQNATVVVIDEGVISDGEEVADLLLRVLKKHRGVAVLEGGMKAYCEHTPALPLIGDAETYPDPVPLPSIRHEIQFTEDETPLKDARIDGISTMVNEAFDATIRDLPNVLRYDYSLLGREVKRLRLHGPWINDTGIRYRVFCAYERDTLIGVLVLKHSKCDAADRWAVVKYVCGLRKGIGFQLQQRAWVFCRSVLNVSTIHAGAWLEFPYAWSRHVRWGYHFCPFKNWPRGESYGSGVVGMRRILDDAIGDASV